MTFCSDKVVKHTCDRELTEHDIDRAQRMGLPIAWGSFCATPEPIKEV